MAKKVKRTTTQKRIVQENKVEWNFPLHKKNMTILLIGLGVIILGYLAMSTGLGDEYALVEGSWNSPLAIGVGPALLVIAYLGIIPYGIMKVFGEKAENSNTDTNE
jgi:hypothetical protein